jgi:hypothetical protein
VYEDSYTKRDRGKLPICEAYPLGHKSRRIECIL